ncbi:MAG TPA: glycosyltransferase [Sulfurimonas autotrophica]|nr:glycosyltransferase [Sulfurimonas autotrophica]
MRIVQLLPELNEGGVERGVMELSRELVKLGHESIIISAGGKLVEQIEKDGGKHIVFDVASKNLLTVPIRLLKLKHIFETLNPDILHARSRVPAWLSYLSNKTLHIPFVTTVHGFNSVNAYSKVMTYGDKVICGSQFMVEHIVNHYKTNMDKIVCIPRGVDIDLFDTQLDKTFIDDFKKKYHLEDAFIITQVARITHLKDQKTAIKAFSEVKKKIKNAKLLFVGSVDKSRINYYESLKEMISHTGYSQDIIFTGNQQKVKEIFAISDVSISASNKPETFGRANVESIFMGTPIIATNIGATADYVIEGENGYLFSPNDFVALANLIVKVKRSVFDTQKMKNYVKTHFSLTQMVSKNMAVYESVKLEKMGEVKT